MDAFQHGDPEADGVTPYSITTSDARTGCAVTLDRTGTVITCTNGALYGAGQNLHGWVSMGPTTATSVRSAASADGATTSYAQPTCASAAPLSGDAPRDPDGHQGILITGTHFGVQCRMPNEVAADARRGSALDSRVRDDDGAGSRGVHVLGARGAVRDDENRCWERRVPVGSRRPRRDGSKVEAKERHDVAAGK